MRRYRDDSKNILVTSNCGEFRLRGTPAQLVQKHEGLGYEALRAKDHVRAHAHFQCAEHYKHVLNGED